MSTTPPLTDQSPITADDPRVAQILALIRAKTGTAATVPTADIPAPTQIAPIAAPQVPPQLGGPTLAQQAMAVNPGPAPNISAMPSMVPQQSPHLPQPPPPNVVPPAQPGPIKSFLQHLVSGLGTATYAGSQAALQHLGMPTDYEKQQNALKIGLQQQQQNSLEGLRQSQQDLYGGKLEQLQALQAPMQIPNDPKYGAFAGQTLPTGAATAVMQKMEGLANAKDIATGKNTTATNIANIKYGPGTYADVSVTKHDGKVFLTHKRTGQEQEIGTDDSLIAGQANAVARARANAQYRTFDTTDANGNPVTISGLDALQGGAAHTPFTQAKGVLSDLVGVKQYEDILNTKITPNLGALNDPAQRAAIAHTLSEAEKNPGALQALITSAIQNGALTQQGAQLAAGIMQGREFGGVARKYGGNMNGTEGLMNRIMANQASPLNAGALNNELIQNDLQFTKRAKGTIAGLMSHNAGNKGGPPNISPTSAPPRPAGVPEGAQWNPQGNNGQGSWRMP